MEEAPVRENAHRRIRPLLSLVACLAIGIVPVVLSQALLSSWLGVGLLDYLPVRAEETLAWFEANSVASSGLGHAYFTVQEAVPAIGTAGISGPVFPVLVSIIMRLTGLTGRMAALPIIAIAMFVGLATLGMLVARSNFRSRWWVGATLVTFGPLILWLGSGVQEPLHLGVAILVAALLHRQLEDPSKRFMIANLVLIAMASTIRPLWAFMLIPALMVGYRDSPRRWRIAFGVGTLAAAVPVFLFAAWSPALPAATARSAQQGLLPNLAWLTNLLTPGGWLSRLGGSTPRSAVWVLPALLLVAVGVIALLSRRGRMPGHERLFAITIALMVVPPVVVLTLSGGTGAARFLAPILLVVSVLAGLRGGKWLVIPAVVILVNVASWSTVQDDYENLVAVNYEVHEESIPNMRDALAPHVQFEPTLEPWCNTVLVNSPQGFSADLVELEVFYTLVSLEPGLGVTIDVGSVLEEPVKSRYVISPATAVTATLAESLVELGDTTLRAKIYENLDTECRLP